MVLTDLETIPVNKLELGMMVHAIGEQAGKLAVKKKGKVSHLNLIDQLSSHGVVSVIIEKVSLPQSTMLKKLNKQKQSLHARKLRRDMPVQTLLKTATVTDIEIELPFASRLIKQSYKIHKKFTDNIKRDYALELKPINTLVLDIYESLSRNPAALLSLSRIMNSNDYLADHSIHAAVLLCFFAKQLGMSTADCKRLALLGYLFDVGMAKIPKDILNKKSTLTDAEEKIMQKHVSYSLDLLAPLHLDNDISLAIEQHHERLVDTGYPNGFSGSKIHKFSRMLAIVDCYDALTSEQAHQAAHSPASALKHLSEPENGYDPKLVIKFIRALGIYPVGSLVLLSNKRIGIVTKNNAGQPNAPVVNVFYSISAGQYLNPQIVNLTASHNELKVIKPIIARHYTLNVDKDLLYR